MTKVTRRSIAKYAATQLTEGAKASKIAVHIAGLLIESNRVAEVDYLIEDIFYELENSRHLVNAKVSTAVELNQKIELLIKEQVKKNLDTGEVLFDNKVDNSLKGGLRIETASRVWDATLSKKLKNLTEAF